MRRHKYLGFALIAVGLYIFWSSIFLPLGADHTSICGQCHAVSTAYGSTLDSQHPDVGCLACHRNPSIGGRLSADFRAWRNLGSLMTDGVRQEKHVDNDACLACHDTVMDEATRSKKIKMSHREVIDAGWRCGECHGNTGHSLDKTKAKLQNPSMDKCFGCHASRAALRKCSLCHVDRPSEEETPTDVRAMGTIAHGPGWNKQGHSLANQRTCNTCHEKTFCKKCHKIELPHSKESWPYQHGAFAALAPKSCPQCHKTQLCDDCHKIAMPHPPEYERGHLSESKSNNDICYNCHFRDQCEACHVAHLKHGVGQ